MTTHKQRIAQLERALKRAEAERDDLATRLHAAETRMAAIELDAATVVERERYSTPPVRERQRR